MDIDGDGAAMVAILSELSCEVTPGHSWGAWNTAGETLALGFLFK